MLDILEAENMDVILKKRMKEHVVEFWEKTQDEEIQKLFPFSIESLEESIKLYKESLKDEALSYGKVIYVSVKSTPHFKEMLSMR